MNDDNKKMLENVLSNSVKTAEENEFKAYLMLDNDFDLDVDREDNNALPKVIIWPKSVFIDGDINVKFEEITKKIIGFTQGVGQQINPRIYVVEDDFPQFVNWLKENNTYKNFIVSISTNDLLKRANPKYNVTGNSSQNVQSEPTLNPETSAPSAEIPTTLEQTPTVAVDPTISVVQPENNSSEKQTVNVAEVPTEPVNTTPDLNQSVQPTVAPEVVTPIAPVESNVTNLNNQVNTEPTVNSQDNSIPPVNHSLDEQANQQQNNTGYQKTLAPSSKMGNVARAGFVKFPVFMLTLMAIGALGIFVGKMVYMYLSSRS